MKNYFKKFSIMFVMALILVLGSCVSAFAEGIDSNTTLLMHMDESGLKDEFGHSVTNSGVTLDATNKVFGNGSAYFDGTNDYISIEKGTDFSFDTGDFTISCFVKTSTYDTSNYYRRIFTLGGGDSANTIQIFFYNNNKITVYSNQVEIAGNRVVADGNWHHVAITRSSGVLRLFVDGVLDGTTTFNNSLTAGTSYSPRIGVYGGNLTGGFFKGNIDELMIVKGKALWTTGFMPPTTPYSEAISLDKSSINLTVNDTQQLTTTTPAGSEIVWSSSDTGVATVDSKGKVTAIKEGQATITAQIKGSNVKATCIVNVTNSIVPPNPTDPGTDETSKIVNIAHAKGDNTNNAGGDVSIIFKGVAEAQLSVVKTADVDSVYVGDTFTYTIVVTNTSSKTAKAVVVNDNAPNHINFSVSGVTTTQGSIDSSSTSKNIIVNVGDIPPLGTVTIKIPATVIL